VASGDGSLLLVVEHGGPAVFARIGIMQALNRENRRSRPEAAARKLVELAANIEAVQDDRMAQVNSCVPVKPSAR
jgi:hypothetical protein